MADVSVTSASVIANSGALIEHGGKAGAAITAGALVYKDSTDSLLKLSDNDSATAGIRTVYGIALNGAAVGQPVTVARRGQVTFNAAFTKGMVYAASGTPGAIAPLADVTTGDDLITIGVALSTTVLDVTINDTGITL